MTLAQGKIFKFGEPEEVIDHLKSLDTKIYVFDPRKLKVALENNRLFLQSEEGLKLRFAIRKAFLYKLLKWFKIPPNSTRHLSNDTIVLICNENLSSIESAEVNVTVENGEALTITSNKYTRITDLEVIENAKKFGMEIDAISRDDFILRINTKNITESQPVVNDICGYGFNIVNSETGFSPVRMEHFIYRYWCSNGATAKINFENRTLFHYGISKHNLFQIVNNQLANAEKSRNKLIDKLEKSVNEDAKKYFDDISMKLNSVVPREKSYHFFKDFEKNSSKYDLFNYITDNAKRYDLLTRYQLERIAGNLILN